MKSTFSIFLFIGSALFLSFALAGDLQTLFREVNAELIAENERNTHTGGFAGMDKTGKIINNTSGIKPGLGLKSGAGTNVIGNIQPAQPTQPESTTAHGISEIAIERTPCYGRCPAYTFTVKADGSFRYSGSQHVEHIGTFTGNLANSAVNDVFLAINALDYMNLNFQYSSNVMDAAAVYSKVVKSGDVKVVENYAGAGPSQLLAVELLIDSLVAQIDWNEARDEASY